MCLMEGDCWGDISRNLHSGSVFLESCVSLCVCVWLVHTRPTHRFFDFLFETKSGTDFLKTKKRVFDVTDKKTL